MLIDEIPDDCLLAIFDYMNSLEDLINCYKVCVKWSYLIAVRTKKTKYLTCDVGNLSDAVYYERSRSIDPTCVSKLFKNLIIVDLPFSFDHKKEDAIEYVKKQESLRGLINRLNVPIEKYCDKLEMLSVEYFNPKNLLNSSSLKQLYIWNYSLEALGRDAHYLPNLERLKITIYGPDNPYDGPVLELLKTLELSTSWAEKLFYGFQLMDSCPNLQSAHISMSTTNWFFDETLKQKCLQDLVIDGLHYLTWNNLKRLLMKYPNLKHLALWNFWDIKDEHIQQLVHILPNLVLLDVRECEEVTQRAADYVKDYCKRNGRSIKFYFDGNRDEIYSDRPQSSSKSEVINRGFDFMKH